jgi:2-polyprenyl-3-methyl-5-hydroxy-6-metoxy-1,4-benzoquinol methylase
MTSMSSPGPKLTYEFIDPEQQIGSDGFSFVERFLQTTGRTEIGWHYITDLAWIFGRVKHWPRTHRILDAGGGSGPLQFFLADLGFQVTNIDMVLSRPAPVDAKRYRMTCKRLKHFDETSYAAHLRQQWSSDVKSMTARVSRSVRFRLGRMRAHLRAAFQHSTSPGRVEWVTGNLSDLRDIPSGTFDAVVSLSALEHIPLEQLATALSELSRVSRPGASWAVTTSGTEQASAWLHEPSQGWCFSAADLEARFGATAAQAQDPAGVLQRYRDCAYLKDHLAGFYRRTDRSGMPWGVWEPRYIPVGLSRG